MIEFTTDVNITRWLIATASMALLLGGLWLAGKKYNLHKNGQSSAKKIKVVETTFLDPRHKAVLMEIEEEKYLTIIGPNAGSLTKMSLKK